jgi:hypothetical protein
VSVGRIDNLKSSELAVIKKDIRRLATTNPLDSGSVHNGRTRFVGEGSLLVEGVNALKVTGSALVSGLLSVMGNLIVSGYHGITGTLSVSGPWNLSGTGGITGDVSSTGAWTQSGTMTLTGAGKIQSSSVVMDAAGLSSPFILNLVTPTVLVSQAIAINGNMTANGQTQLNQLRVSGLPIASGTVYAVVADSSGNLYRKSVAS